LVPGLAGVSRTLASPACEDGLDDLELIPEDGAVETFPVRPA
jgi:hypothetical protein